MRLDVLTLTQALVACPSITPKDAGCQDIIAEILESVGFEVERFSHNGVSNLWARKGTTAPLYCFAGHTDVVPTGPLAEWRHPPFAGTCVEGTLYGRGVADMKGALAAMLVAVSQWQAPGVGSLGFIITSDEEGPSVDGTQRVLEILATRGIQIDGVIIGEPTAEKQVGDVIKNGRRGSLHAQVRFEAAVDHVAYAKISDNVIFQGMQGLVALLAHPWDKGQGAFPATTCQIVAIHSDSGASNMIPGIMEAHLNWRFSPALTPDQIQSQSQALLAPYGEYNIDWTLSGLAFFTDSSHPLVRKVSTAIAKVLGHEPLLSTAGGTSDGRFFANYGIPVIECGLLHSSIHQVNESSSIEGLHQLTAIYQQILEQLFGA